MCGVPTAQIELSLTFDPKPANNPPVRPGNFVYNTQCPEAAGPGFDSDGHQKFCDLQFECCWSAENCRKLRLTGHVPGKMVWRYRRNFG
jgi:hypothetical protein